MIRTSQKGARLTVGAPINLTNPSGKKAHRTCLERGGGKNSVCFMVDQSYSPVPFGPVGSSSRLNSRVKRK